MLFVVVAIMVVVCSCALSCCESCLLALQFSASCLLLAGRVGCGCRCC